MEMQSIRYTIHFPALLVAGVIFWLARDLSNPVWIANFNFLIFGLMGALHSTSIIIGLRNRKAVRPLLALCFFTLAFVWSAATPILSLWGSIVWIPLTWIFPPSPVFLFLTGSMIGSSGYWLLVRLFWLRSLRRSDWLRTVALCFGATALACTIGNVLPTRETGVGALYLLLTIAWWFAFSISLYWSERQACRRVEALAIESTRL